MKRSHLIIFSACFGIIIASIVASALFWGDLPTKIPTHFGLSGAPDAWSDKNIWYVFMVPAINLVMAGLFAVIYSHPQYTSWPTTLILMTIDEEKRDRIFGVFRSMISWILLLVSLMFGYLQFSILATANGRSSGVTNYVMIAFLFALFSCILIVNVRMFITVHQITKEHKHKKL